MGTFYRGCFTLLAILVAFIAVIVVLAMMCGPDDGESVSQPRTYRPTSTPPPVVNAADLFYEYQRNETRANAYKRRWLTVTLTRIDEIGSGGEVRKQMISGMNPGRIQLDFKNERDVMRLNPGDSVTAICKLAGKETAFLAGGFVVRFFDCRLVSPR